MMTAVYDIRTGQPLPVEDPPDTPPDEDTEGMTEGERRAYWMGVRQGIKDYARFAVTAEEAAESARVVREYLKSRRPRLEVAR